MCTNPQSAVDALLRRALDHTLSRVLLGEALELSDRLLIQASILYQEAQLNPIPHSGLHSFSDCYFAVVNTSSEVEIESLDDPRYECDFD